MQRELGTWRPRCECSPRWAQTDGGPSEEGGSFEGVGPAAHGRPQATVPALASASVALGWEKRAGPPGAEGALVIRTSRRFAADGDGRRRWLAQLR